MSLDIGVDLQLQIFILAGVFGLIAIILVFFLAGVCGQLSRMKRQQKKLLADRAAPIAAYDNFAYNSRNIQPDEELGRRGFTMYDPYRNSNQPNVHQSLSHEKHEPMQDTVQETTVTVTGETVANVEGIHDETADYSITHSETVVLTGNDVEMKIQRQSYPPEFHGIPPPPAFVNRFDIGIEPNTSDAKTDDRQ